MSDMVERVAMAIADNDPDSDGCVYPIHRSQARAAIEATEVERLQDFADWVDTWVSNPVSSYSVSALDGLFAVTRHKLAVLRREHEQ